MASTFRVRRVERTQENLDIISKLDRRIFATDSSVMEEDRKTVVWWIVYSQTDEPVGYCAMRVDRQWNRGYFVRAGVLTKVRGNRIHRRLISVRRNHARRLGLKELCTYTYAYNCRSINNLIRAGFEIYVPRGWIKNYEGFTCWRAKV